MKRPVKILIIAAIILLLIAVLILIVIRSVSYGALPVYDKDITISGLIEPVEVMRDERGVPHIYAENEHDLYIVTGYIMAQERLWQMDLIRRATTGRLSEIFGDEYVETDLFMRSLRMTEKSERIIASSNPEIIDAVEWFVRGVNSYINDTGKRLPPEFRILGYKPEPWTMENTVNIIGYMGWDLASGNLSGDIFLYRLLEEAGEEITRQLTPWLDYQGTVVYPGFVYDDVDSIVNAGVSDTGTSYFNSAPLYSDIGTLFSEPDTLYSNSGASCYDTGPLFSDAGTLPSNSGVSCLNSGASCYDTGGFCFDDVALVIHACNQLEALGISPFSGSNNWALSGEFTETGLPLLSNDMHLGLSAPGIWIRMHQIVPGKLNVTGVLVPGEPFIVAGHNDSIAWGMTNLTVDDIDLFNETISESDSSLYLFNREWREMNVVSEVIGIKGGDSVAGIIRYTHRGPLISGFRNVKNSELSMRWSGYDMSNEISAVYNLNRASDFTGFRTALEGFGSVSQNFIYADVKGNIGLQAGGGIPLRKGHGTMIRPGDTDEFDWTGYLDFNDLPYTYNPVGGSVSSANNPTVDKNYPWCIGTYFSMPYRINRIREMLSEQEIFGVDDFKRMVTDRHSAYAAGVIPLLLSSLEDIDLDDPAEREMVDSLLLWDYDMSPDQITPTFFEYFTDELGRELLADNLGELKRSVYGTVRDYYIYRVISGERDTYIDNISTSRVEDLDEVMVSAYKSAIGMMKENHGNSDNWMWGKLHRFTAAHPLGSVRILDRIFKFNSEAYPVGGSWHTVSPYSWSGDFVIDHGASQRHIYNCGNWDDSWTVIPTGTSGVPASEFYLSQTETYCNDGFYRDPFSRIAVETAAVYRTIFKSK